MRRVLPRAAALGALLATAACGIPEPPCPPGKPDWDNMACWPKAKTFRLPDGRSAIVSADGSLARRLDGQLLTIQEVGGPFTARRGAGFWAGNGLARPGF